MVVMPTSKIRFSSAYESLSQVEKMVEEVCDENHISEDNYGNILVAVTEAVNNAIQHGNKFDPTKEIEVEYEKRNLELVFRITDQGLGFDYTSIPDPTDPQNLEKINGRGVFLMRNLADKVNFLENGRIVELCFIPSPEIAG
jgi:serine/threonine-protein kinase RsbW